MIKKKISKNKLIKKRKFEGKKNNNNIKSEFPLLVSLTLECFIVMSV